MTMKCLAILGVFGFVAATAQAAESDATEGTTSQRMLGVGYKIGNGIGFVGADLIVSPLPHLSLDIQASRFSAGEGSTGMGLAPAVQAALFADGDSTPYVGVGMQYARLTLGDVTATGTGFFANAGYEFKWSFGLGILLGLGVQHLNKVEATNGINTVSMGGSTALNLEAGVRYMFW